MTEKEVILGKLEMYISENYGDHRLYGFETIDTLSAISAERFGAHQALAIAISYFNQPPYYVGWSLYSKLMELMMVFRRMKSKNKDSYVTAVLDIIGFLKALGFEEKRK